MKTIAAIALLGLALADPTPLSDQTTDKNTAVHYRRFNADMVGKPEHGGRWFEKEDPNINGHGANADADYNGPHNPAWKEVNSKNSYWSYDEDRNDSGMKAHNHIRQELGIKQASNWDSQTATDDSAKALWEAYMKKEKFFSMEWNAEDPENGYRSANIEGGDSGDRLENLGEHANTYMQPKDHMQFFKVGAEVCNPEPAREGKDQANLIKGLRARHNSGHTYQGCSLDNCAMTVMYACSFMCSTCQAKWCRDQCQAQKERSGSCFKIWEDIESSKCKSGKFDTKSGDNFVLNKEAPLK